MLRIYPVVVEVLRQLQPALKRIEVKDRDLGRQLRRCSSSIALDCALNDQLDRVVGTLVKLVAK